MRGCKQEEVGIYIYIFLAGELCFSAHPASVGPAGGTLVLLVQNVNITHKPGNVDDELVQILCW